MFIQMHLHSAPSLGFDICYEVNICRFFERSFLYSTQESPSVGLFIAFVLDLYLSRRQMLASLNGFQYLHGKQFHRKLCGAQ